MPDPGDLLETVARAARVREGSEGVRSICRAIRAGGTVSTRHISRATRLPLPVVAAVRGELTTHGILERRPTGMGLTAKGMALAEALFGPDAPRIATNTPEETPEPPSDSRLGEFAHRLGTLLAGRPDADVTLDQSKATADTVAKRVDYLDRNDSISGRRILCLGDDDFLSAAINEWVDHESGSGRSVRPMEVMALDIDERVVQRLRSLGVDARIHDLRQPLPEDIRGCFDVVVTDPPYTPQGAALFLGRAAEATAPGGRCFFSFGHLDPPAMREAQASASGIGWVVVEWMPGFNEYEGGAVIGNRSLMAQLTLAAAAENGTTESYDGPLYTADRRPVVKKYQCQKCHTRWEVGAAARWQTIAALKSDTCPDCGGDRFKRIGQR